MSRAQGIRGIFASQTCTPGIVGKLLPELGTHGLRWKGVCPPFQGKGANRLGPL